LIHQTLHGFEDLQVAPPGDMLQSGKKTPFVWADQRSVAAADAIVVFTSSSASFVQGVGSTSAGFTTSGDSGKQAVAALSLPAIN
jgi:hypothetical protein